MVKNNREILGTIEHIDEPTRMGEVEDEKSTPDIEKSTVSIARIVSANSESDSSYFEGLARYQRGLTDSAIFYFQKAMQAGTNKVSCLLMIALCHMKKGNYREAKRCLESGLAVDGITETETIALTYQHNRCRRAIDKQDKDEDSPRRYRDLSKKIAILNDRFSEINRKHTPIANEVFSLKRTDDPVAYEPQEVEKGPSALGFALSSVIVSMLLFASYVAFMYYRSDDEGLTVETVVTDILAPSREAPRIFALRNSRIAYIPRPELQVKAQVQGIKISHAMGKPVIIVLGVVSNLTDENRVGVLLEGKVLDSEGNIISLATAPCGKLSSTDRIEKTEPIEIESLYQEQGKLFECTVSPGQQQRFQLIFRGLPRLEDLGRDLSLEIDALAGPYKPQVSNGRTAEHLTATHSFLQAQPAG